jgi:hypothetical protein
MRRRHVAVVAGAALVAVTAVTVATATPSPKAYMTPVGGSYTFEPLMSVGDVVKETSNPGQKYQMIGIPDGLSAAAAGGDVHVWMNHELNQARYSEPVLGGPLSIGAFVSKFVVSKNGKVVSGERAYDHVFVENAYAGPAAEVGNTTRAFSRFCSGALATAAHGFTQNIYLTGEESDAPGTFDPAGGQAVAIYDNEAHVLPKLGRYSKENIVPQPRSDGPSGRTVLVGLEDGPNTPDSQLYLWVGTRNRSGASVLERNGLASGKLYVFKADDSTKSSEADFASGSLTGSWVEITSPGSKTDTELEAAADAAGAFGFVRVEDGAFNPTAPRKFYFVTTGESQDASGNPTSVNRLGRVYELTLSTNADPSSGAATLELVVNADTVVGAGGDTALSPDNVDASSGWFMVQEDGTAPTRQVFANKGREAGIWRFPISGGELSATGTRIAEHDTPARDGTPVPVPGTWESSGIVDTGAIFGAGTWLFDVQAHSPTKAPDPTRVGPDGRPLQQEDGQLLLMRPAG